MIRRSWETIGAAPLWAHALALGALLLALVPVVGTSASFSSDEGAYIFQARALSERSTWVIPHPLPAADPDGSSFPLALAESSDDGFVAVAKHPAYSGVLAAFDRFAGVTGMVALSVLATVAAAVGGGLIARRLDRRLAIPALWAIGIASPLFFDAYLVLAHSVAAALAGFLVLALLVARHHLRPGPLIAIAACSAAAVMMRREAILFVAAAVLVVGIDSVANRHPKRMLIAASIAAAGAAGALADQLLQPSVGGSAVDAIDPVPTTLAGRPEAFVTTWLNGGYSPFRSSELVVTTILVLGVILVGLVRWRPRDRRIHVTVGAAVLAASIGLVALVPIDPVPGLLAASPVVAYGLMSMRRPRGETAVVLAIAGAFSIAVILTQYDRGGSLEWGGRYFAMGLPVLIPGLLVGVRALVESLDRISRHAVLAALVVSSLALAISAVTTLRDSHRQVDDLVSSAVTLGARFESGDGGDPVIVTTDEDLGRLSWSRADVSRWLYSEGAELGELLVAIRGAGVDHIVLATHDSRLARSLANRGLITVLETQTGGGAALSLLGLVEPDEAEGGGRRARQPSAGPAPA